jgi:hypothetical protein
MLSLFKRKPMAMTFKTRVDRWWDWYGGVSQRFFETIEAGDCGALVEEVSDKVTELLPGFAWVFGPGEGGQGHSFTLSGEGNRHRQLLTQFWHSRAPVLEGWTFHAARQPGTIKGMVMDIDDRRFDPIEFWLTPYVNKDTEKVDLTVWHPAYDELEESARWQPLFLFLDEVMGEYGTEQWIGEIQLNNQRLAESIPLAELRGFVDGVAAETGWEKFTPGEGLTCYELEPHERFARGDIIVGTTCLARLVNEYVDAEGELEDPLAGMNADYVYAAFDVQFLPQGKQSEARGEIEEALDAALREAASGRLIGGAHGLQCAYVDLLLFDAGKSLAIAEQVLRARGLPAGTRLEYFAKEKRVQRVVL